MKSFKKAVVSCALLVTMIAPARASLGTGFGAPVAVVAGVAAIGVSGVAAIGGIRLIKQGSTVAGIGVLALAAAGGFFGLILLDGEQKAEFSELSSETAQDLKISAIEREIYNSEVEQVNAIAREIGSELTKQGSDSAELARDMWIELGSELSPETMKTVIAIAQQG
jgi:hypothetical protein